MKVIVKGLDTMGFTGNKGFGIAYAGFYRMQLSIALGLGLSENDLKTLDFSSLTQDDLIIDFLSVDGFWEVKNEQCNAMADRIEQVIPFMVLVEGKMDYSWDAKDLVRALRETAIETDEFKRDFIMW